MRNSILEYTIDYHNEHQYKKLNESLLFGVSYFTAITVTTIMYALWVLIRYILGFHSLQSEIRRWSKELPELSQSLQEVIKDPEVKVYQLRDKEPNAYSVGDICYITNTLYDMLSEKERLAVLLHEYGHYHRKHMIKQAGVEMTTGILSVAAFQAASLYFLGFFIPFVFYFGKFMSTKMTLILARAQEYDADTYVKELGYHKELASALKKIERWIRNDICQDLKRSECEEALNLLSDKTTHPTFKERIERLLEKPIIKKFMFVTAISNFSPKRVFEKLKRLIT